MKSVEDLYREMVERFSQETGMEVSGTGEMAVRLYALAAQLYGLYEENAWTKKQCFPQTATGEELDKHAALRGLIRNEAVRAAGQLRFSVTETVDRDLTIPAGTVCMTVGLVSYETTREGVIEAGETSVDVPARAAEAGLGGNTPAGTIRTMAVAPVGVASCTNPAPFTGGAETEEDEALRARVLDTYRRMPNGTNRAYYEQQALGVEGVAAVSVIGKNRGLGTVDVVIASADGLPSEELVEAVQADLNAKREIAVDVLVLAPTQVTVDISVQVKAESGADGETVRAGVTAALSAWFDGTRLGESVLLARLGQRIYEVAGVENYRILEPMADVSVTAGQLPMLGTLTVEELP